MVDKFTDTHLKVNIGPFTNSSFRFEMQTNYLISNNVCLIIRHFYRIHYRSTMLYNNYGKMEFAILNVQPFLQINIH